MTSSHFITVWIEPTALLRTKKIAVFVTHNNIIGAIEWKGNDGSGSTFAENISIHTNVSYGWTFSNAYNYGHTSSWTDGVVRDEKVLQHLEVNY